MAHIKVVRRSMRPEEWTDLRFGWLKRHIYNTKWEIENLLIRDARQVDEMQFEYYSEDYRPLKRGDMYFTPDGTAFIKADVKIPEELKGIATTLNNKDNHIKNRLISEIINEFILYYQNLIQKDFIEEYSKRLLGLNEEITVKEAETEFKGIVTGIDDMCRLKIRLPDGREKVLNSAL